MRTRSQGPARVALDGFGNPVEAVTGPQKVVYWEESGANQPRDPVAERVWSLATLAMLFVVMIAAVGPMISG